MLVVVSQCKKKNAKPNYLSSAILMIKLRVTRYKLISHEYELRTSYFYCTSYELLFKYELRVTVYCRSYELLFTYEVRVTVYCTGYKLLFMWELQVVINCTSYELYLLQ